MCKIASSVLIFELQILDTRFFNTRVSSILDTRNYPGNKPGRVLVLATLTADLHQHIFDHWRFLSLWWLKQFARLPWFSSHQFNRSTWVCNFLGTILHRILVFTFNAFMESIYCIISLRLCRRVFDHFNRLRPSWLQQSVQHCLLLHWKISNITNQRADRTISFWFSDQCPKGERTTRRRDEDGEEKLAKTV